MKQKAKQKKLFFNTNETKIKIEKIKLYILMRN